MEALLKKAIRHTFIILFLAGAFFFVYMMATVPNIAAFSNQPMPKTAIISSDGYEIGQITRKNLTYVPRDEIPQFLIEAVVAVEDKRFWSHFGIDLYGIGRAVYIDLREGEIVEGGSTITQQTATLLFYSKQKSYIRKIREALTAIQLERKYTKEEILTIYLNEVYFGGGAYGVYEAAEVYFSKKPMDMTLAECAMLAGIIQAPSAYAPFSEESYGYATERKEKVLNLMAEQGKISAEQRPKPFPRKWRSSPAARPNSKPGCAKTAWKTT